MTSLRRIHHDDPLPETLARDPETIDYRTIFEQYMAQSADGMLVIGRDRTVVAANSVARAMLGYAAPLPRHVSEVVHDRSVEYAVGDVYHDRRDVWHETYLPHPDRLLRFHLIPIRSPIGIPSVVVATVTDVTRLRHLETVRRDFVANVSHEFRTPIAAINLLVETLQQGALEDPDAARHFLNRIEVETHAMGHLVEELLEFSRLESGVVTLDLDTADITQLVEQVVDRLTPLAREKTIDLDVALQEQLPAVRVDVRRIEQVLINLIHNAIKFTPDDGKVVVQGRREGLGVKLEVIDTGIGMNAADGARIFERFYKADAGRTRGEGAGLGLAIAHHLLALHGSRLQVTSEPDRGSRFFFALPLAD